MQAATTQIATKNMKTMHPTAAPTITVVLLPSKHGYRKCKIHTSYQLYLCCETTSRRGRGERVITLFRGGVWVVTVSSPDPTL